MSKCSYTKNRPFIYCTGYAFGILNQAIKDNVKLKCCPVCGVNLPETEPEQPIIKKSGDTLVARDQGIDYLLVKVNSHILEMYALRDYEVNSIVDINNDEHFGIWKRFSEIKINDALSKFRPMVKHGCLSGILYAVLDNKWAFVRYNGTIGFDDYRLDDKEFKLATVSDLED